MKIQFDVPAEINRKLKFYKLENNLDNLGEAIMDIVNKFFKKKEAK